MNYSIMNGPGILVNIAQHPNWALDSVSHYISARREFYVPKPCQALLNWQGYREGTIQTSWKLSLLLSVSKLEVYSFKREMEQFFKAVTDQYSKCTVFRKTQHRVILYQYAYQSGYQSHISTLPVLIKFVLEYKCLNMHFYVEKKSLKESKVDSRTHFAGDDLLTRYITFWWSLKSVSQKTHCPFKAVCVLMPQSYLGPSEWIFWVIEMIQVASVFLKANFSNFEGLGISGGNTDQFSTENRKIAFDNQGDH